MGFRHLILFILFFTAIHAPVTAQSVTALASLQFGDQIFPGISQTVTPGDAGASEFKITGEGGREVQVTFNLPSDLIDNFNNKLPISYGSTSGRYSVDELVSSSTTFDPQNGFTATLSLTGELFIWVGGTIYPDPSQPGNAYSGDITINVVYTTN